MFKKFLMAALLLPLVSIAMADQDGPNPGDDNPGSTTLTLPFFFGANFSGGASCLDTADWCAAQFADPLTPAVESRRGKRAKISDASASAFAAVACNAAAEAASYFALWFEGGGEFTLTRHGNHGAMHHIELNAGLASGTLTVAQASAEASAIADAQAIVAAEVSGFDEVCTDVEILDITIAELCASWVASAVAEADATAHASSFASSEAFAASGSFGAVASHTEVWAANIEEFRAAVATAAGSFSIAHAEAFAEAIAEAYANAYADAFVDACASLEVLGIEWEICSVGWNAAAEAHASAYAHAYAEAQASAFAGVIVEAYLPATYINENGIYDTISFGPDAQALALAALGVSCEVTEEPNGD